MGKKKNPLPDLDEYDKGYIEAKMGRVTTTSCREEVDSLFIASKRLSYNVDLKCKNKKQKDLVKSIQDNKITIVKGVFGVGKTYVINSMALKLLKESSSGIDKIILIMPTLEVGDMHLGLLPGDLSEKLVSHSMNELDSFQKILKNSGNLGSKQIIDDLMVKGLIEIRPISFLRGASLNNAFICVSEAEEFTKDELFLIISRYEGGRMVISGDPLQSSRKNVKKGDSGLLHAIDRLKDTKDIGIIEFSEEDIVRNDILLEIYNKWKN